LRDITPEIKVNTVEMARLIGGQLAFKTADFVIARQSLL
jgi:hypothetical protein